MRVHVAAGVLLMATSLFAVEPVTITFDEWDLRVGLNTGRAETIFYKGVQFEGGFLSDYPTTPDPAGPRSSKRYYSGADACFGCGTIHITFQQEVESIELTIGGAGQAGTEVWDGFPYGPSSKLIGRLAPYQTSTIVVPKMTVGPSLWVFSYFVPQYSHFKVTSPHWLDTIKFTPKPPAGDEMPVQPVLSHPTEQVPKVTRGSS